MIGLLGIGQGGGNIGDQAAKEGVPAIAVNYSEMDLNSLEYVQDKLHLVGTEGCGHDRGLATSLMKDNWESAVQFVKRHFSTPSIEVILVAFSVGGGSGSGISPILLEFLQDSMPDKVFVAVPILPQYNEPLVNQYNCLSAFEELKGQDICILPIDNQKATERFGMIPKNKVYSYINSEFIKLLTDIVSYTDKHSKNGILDKKDLLTLFRTKGIGLLSCTDLKTYLDQEVSNSLVADKIHQSWEESIFTTSTTERLLRTAIVFDGEEKYLDYIRLEQVYKPFKSAPVDVFEGFYAESSNPKVITFLTGLNWIEERLLQVDNIITEKKANITLESQSTESLKDKHTQFTQQIRQTSKPKRSALDIFSKYQR